MSIGFSISGDFANPVGGNESQISRSPDHRITRFFGLLRVSVSPW